MGLVRIGRRWDGQWLEWIRHHKCLPETRDLLLIIEIRLRIGGSSRQHVNYILVCAVSHESRVGGFKVELVLVPKQSNPALQGAASVAASLLEQANFVPNC
jgi:hypothetical protein